MRAILLCSRVAFLDGIDSHSIVLGAFLIADTMHLADTVLKPIFSAGLFGAPTFGPLGERFVSKRMLVLAAVTFGVFTFLTAYVQSCPMLLLTCFLSGGGQAGAPPCFIGIASEYAPLR